MFTMSAFELYCLSGTDLHEIESLNEQLRVGE